MVRSPGELVGGMADAIITFAPSGWAPSSLIPTQPYSAALHTYRETGNLEAAEAVLVEAWNEQNRLRLLLRPLLGLGAGYEPLNETFRLRWRLVDKALRHHEAGSFEASVPIVLAQIDGIVSDVTEQQAWYFQGKGRASYLVDDRTVAGLPEGLEPLRNLVSRSVKHSGATGALVRHGILHGQELGYDTLINSTKAFVLLLEIVDWAQPRARKLANRLQHEREERYAGSNALDERGRRMDRRGFDRAKDGLRNLALRQIAEYRHHQRYGFDLDAMFPGQAQDDDFLRNRAEVTLMTSEDRQQFWAWRTTPSGFCFGIAGREGSTQEWLYAESSPPTGGSDAEAKWKGPGQLHSPDWS